VSLGGIRVEVGVSVITLHAFVVGIVLHTSWNEVELSIGHVIGKLGLAHTNSGQWLVLVRNGARGAVVANCGIDVVVRCVGEVKVEIGEVVGLAVGPEEHKRLNAVAFEENIP